MADLHTVYQLTIRTLSPLHIGTGNRLLRDYDYVARNGKTWVIDSGVLAEMLYEHAPGEFQRMASGTPAADLIHPDEFKEDSPLFRYVMDGEPRSRARGSEIQEQVKDPWDRPYIPGSSLKGALRTALAFVGAAQRKIRINPAELGRDSRFAAQPLEQRVLNSANPPRGKVPNHDVLRALQISDSTPAEDPKLHLLNAQVTTGKTHGSPIELEAVPRGATFTATLTLDGFLLSESVRRELGWKDDQRLWLRNIAQVANLFTQDRLVREQERWKNIDAPIRSFYQQFNRMRIDERSEFFLQLGWGGGWDSKTFGSLLSENEAVFSQMVNTYGKRLIRQGTHQVGDRFPKTRRVVIRNDEPAQPFGWIHVKMERVR